MIDPEATEVVPLPWELCKPKPDGSRWHDSDTVTVRTEYGYGDTVELARVHTDAGRIDAMGERVKLIEIGLKDWSLVGPDGAPIPVTLDNLMRLPPNAGQYIAQQIDERFSASDVPVPNDSSGRSQPSSLASSTASPNRAQKRAAKRSTSKS